MGLSLTQRKALAIVPKFSGAFSMIGSGFIIYDVLSHRGKKKQTYSRILLVMSCFDFVTSFMYALSTWPIPSGSGPIYASGTTGSCTFQGFFIQLSLAAPFYNFCLKVYYMLVIKYKWSDYRIKEVEKFAHPIAIAIAIGLAIAGLPLTIYNNANVWCWIAPGPEGSGRGANATVYRWALYYVELWLIIVAVTCMMLSIVMAVTKTEKASRQICMTTKTKNLASNVKVQAVLYILAFYITWAFPTTLRILQTIDVEVPYAIFLCAVIFTPLQGFFNCLIYLRPRYIRFRVANPEAGVFKSMRHVVKQPTERRLPATVAMTTSRRSSTTVAPTSIPMNAAEHAHVPIAKITPTEVCSTGSPPNSSRWGVSRLFTSKFSQRGPRPDSEDDDDDDFKDEAVVIAEMNRKSEGANSEEVEESESADGKGPKKVHFKDEAVVIAEMNRVSEGANSEEVEEGESTDGKGSKKDTEAAERSPDTAGIFYVQKDQIVAV